MFIYEAACKKVFARSEKGDEDHCVKSGIWSYRMYFIRNNWTYI